MAKLWKPWTVGLVGLLALPVATVLFDLGPVEDWLPVYAAGAMGGFVLELSSGGWGVELPSVGHRPPKGSQFAPFGEWVDLGFLGRMITGAIAAPVFLIAINVIPTAPSEKDLASLGHHLDNIVWGVLIGAASPAAWKVGGELVDARLSAAKTASAAAQLEKAEGNITHAHANGPKADVKEPLVEAQASIKAARDLLGAPEADD